MKKINALSFYILSFSLFKFSLAFSSVSQVSQNSSAVSSGLAGSGMAAVAPGDINTLNPATLIHLPGYYFYSKFGAGETAYAISDNTYESAIPASVYYYQKTDFRSFKLTFADKISKRVNIGINLSYYQNFSPDPVNPEDKITKSFLNADVGLSYIVKPQLGLAFVFYDIKKNDEDLWQDDHFISPKWGAGIHYAYKGFLRCRLDYKSGNDFQIGRGILMGGLEDYMSRWVAIRLGYQENYNDLSQLTTFGIGFDLPKFKFNYAYINDIKDNTLDRHSIDLSIPF